MHRADEFPREIVGPVAELVGPVAAVGDRMVVDAPDQGKIEVGDDLLDDAQPI